MCRTAAHAPRKSGVVFAIPAPLGTSRRAPISTSRPIPSRDPPCIDGAKSRDLNVENDSRQQILRNHHQRLARVAAASVRIGDRAAGKSALRVPAAGAGQGIPAERDRPDRSRLPPAPRRRFREKLFVGPKLQSQLAATGPHLERTVDFGILTVLAQPLFATLNWVHGLVGNWGWAIIIVTALIKLLFYPLSQASGRSMAKMRTVAPRMKQIQETFKDDREKLGPRHDGAVQEGKNQSAGRLPAHAGADSLLHFVLPGAARKRGNAPGAVSAVGQRSVLARSLLRAAAC